MSSDSPGRVAGAIVSSCKVSARQGDTRMIRDPLISRLVSVTEAAGILGVNRSHVHRLIKESKLPAAYAGDTLVLAEERVHRYAAGERFGYPCMLLVYVYDQEQDGWEEIARQGVPPEYELPGAFSLADFGGVYVGGVAGRDYRVELVDQHGKTLAVKPVEGA